MISETASKNPHKAKKSMGQNFLKSQEALRMMITAGKVTSLDTIIEIGPGKGALTTKLLENAGKVIAIEKDRDLIALLEEKFADDIQKGKFILINQDILNFDPADHGITNGNYKIIANIPYNITGAIIKRFLSETIQPSAMVLLVQKEVAIRIVARDQKESILSLSVKAYGVPTYCMKVSKRFFSPSPKVDSAIIAINAISKGHFKTSDEENLYFTIIKAAFAHKRKVLRKNLESIVPQENIDKLFNDLHIPSQSRAEDVPFSVWLEINHRLGGFI